MSSQRIFTKQTSYHWPFLLLIIFSLGSMWLDVRLSDKVTFVRNALSYVVAPITLMVDYPQRLWRTTQSLLSSKTSLLQENMQLRYRQTLLEAKLQRLLILKEENTQLKALLRTTSRANSRAIAAQTLDVDLNQSRQILVLDKGIQHGVQLGQAVLNAKGVIGQIIDVGPFTSTVLLISDGKSAVPIRNHRTNEWGILMGVNRPDTLKLLNLPKTSPVREGDLLVTSGLGGHYPEGYPIGEVEGVQHLPGEAFIQVAVKPIASLNRSQLVLILLSDGEKTELIKQIHARLAVLGVTV